MLAVFHLFPVPEMGAPQKSAMTHIYSQHDSRACIKYTALLLTSIVMLLASESCGLSPHVSRVTTDVCERPHRPL